MPSDSPISELRQETPLSRDSATLQYLILITFLGLFWEPVDRLNVTVKPAVPPSLSHRNQKTSSCRFVLQNDYISLCTLYAFDKLNGMKY